MAGTDPDFDPDEFRRDIRATMLMGLPEDAAQRPIFVMVDTRTYPAANREGVPFDLTTAAVGDPPAEVTCGDGEDQVVCTWEQEGGRRHTEETSIGDFDPERMILTMLDVDFTQVEGFAVVRMGDADYEYNKELPRRGLHDVTVHQFVVVARDEA